MKYYIFIFHCWLLDWCCNHEKNKLNRTYSFKWSRITCNWIWKKRCNLEVGSISFDLSDRDEYSLRNRKSEGLKSNKYNDLEHMVITMNLTYNEIERLLGIGSDLQLCELTGGFHKIVDNKIFLPSFITVTFHDIRLGTILSIEPKSAVLKFGIESFSLTVLEFTSSNRI